MSWLASVFAFLTVIESVGRSGMGLAVRIKPELLADAVPFVVIPFNERGTGIRAVA